MESFAKFFPKTLCCAFRTSSEKDKEYISKNTKRVTKYFVVECTLYSSSNEPCFYHMLKFSQDQQVSGAEFYVSSNHFENPHLMNEHIAMVNDFENQGEDGYSYKSVDDKGSTQIEYSSGNIREFLTIVQNYVTTFDEFKECPEDSETSEKIDPSDLEIKLMIPSHVDAMKSHADAIKCHIDEIKSKNIMSSDIERATKVDPKLSQILPKSIAHATLF